ncbi:MAG: hypothetical protein JWO44_1960 [Bacteroidetes bacterium]|jgi:hypothetical protein|nr:hypothetical protein [Bacteroidota bacterium]
MRLFILSILTLLCTCSGIPEQNKVAAGDADKGLSLSIIPFSYAEMIMPNVRPKPAADTAWIQLYGADYRFHVLLQNNSGKPINIWQEWNSWGYFCLSFEVTYPDGTTEIASKTKRGWDKNFASAQTIAPGGYYVFDVTFDSKTWINSPLKKSPDRTICKLKALYQVTESPESKEYNVWTGKVASATADYIIWH